MSNTVITNYTDLNGPSTKTDSSVVVIVNKDGTLSVDKNLLGTLMGSDGSQAAGISVVRVGHEGRPDDATDSENEDDKVPHVTLSVDSYYDEPNSIIKYDSGAEMLQSLRIETRENSLIGFQNDHCYTSLTSPSQSLPQRSDSFVGYDDPVIEIINTPPPKAAVVNPKKITILDHNLIPKGKKIVINPSDGPVILKGNDVINKSLPTLTKSKHISNVEKPPPVQSKQLEESTESSSISSSGDSTADRDSDSDYKETRERSGSLKLRKTKTKPRILKHIISKVSKIEPRTPSRVKSPKNTVKRDLKEKLVKSIPIEKKADLDNVNTVTSENQTATELPVVIATVEQSKISAKQPPKMIKKEKKTPAHVTALLSDMTSLFSTPDVIRRVSTDTKVPPKIEKDILPSNKKDNIVVKPLEINNDKLDNKQQDTIEKPKPIIAPKTYMKSKDQKTIADKPVKSYDLIPQLDDVSLAQILQDTSGGVKVQPSITTANSMNSPGLAGPLSPTLDLLGALQPEDGLTEDLLMHVAQLVESSENLQEVIDKQVLGKVDAVPVKPPIQANFQETPVPPAAPLYSPITPKPVKTTVPRKDPIEIVRKDGRVITLPPIEAPATRASKRKSQVESSIPVDAPALPVTTPLTPITPVTPVTPMAVIAEPLVMQNVSRQYSNKKIAVKKPEPVVPPPPMVEKISAESQESWNSEDDPNRLWCICKQPHNNRFMICCDGCEDWFHGKCVNITKAMGQQMEEQGIEWRCPNCVKNAKPQPKVPKIPITLRASNNEATTPVQTPVTTKEAVSKTSCIVCKKSARASSIYCSDTCILKHAQDSLSSPSTSKSDNSSGKTATKQNSDARVIVYERKSGRLLAGPNAPTAENLKSWLQKNPTFEVVRPGTLSTIKPNAARKKISNEPNKIQTTLNFARIPKKSTEQPHTTKTPQPEVKEKLIKLIPTPKEEVKVPPQPKTPTTPRSKMHSLSDTPKTSNKNVSEPRKIVRASTSRSQSTQDKTPSVTPSTSRRKDTPVERKMSAGDPIRENVKKALQEQLTIRMKEGDGPKFTEQEIVQFAVETESELYELFNKDVGMKYKAKYRSLMFNIKDRKNLSLWLKICDKTLIPKQLVRLSPEELASQELAQWRDKEAKYQLELIKKSELDLLAASKTYVLKTHKGEEVMETKESVSTELDPNVAVEDLVPILNDEISEEPASEAASQEKSESKEDTDKKQPKKKEKDSTDSGNSKKSRESRRDSESRKSRSSRRKSEFKEKESRSSRRSVRKSSRSRSDSKERSKTETAKEKPDSRSRSRRRSRSKVKPKRRSKDHSRSTSRGRDRSRSKRRSQSRDSGKKRRRSRSKHRASIDEKHKNRSKSQEVAFTKSKNDSTDSDSIERPKSATLKDVHPEYDPHEPMITSAFSEEDLRKSREDVYEDTYKNEVFIPEYNMEYETNKVFMIESPVILPIPRFKQEKTSEAESDQEPSSTVENSAATVWNGCINMVDVARFYVAAHEVSGNTLDLEEDLTAELDIVGRINPDTVWDYINKTKRASNKDIIILRLQAANDEEKMQYIALYSYLSSRNRLGVVKVLNTAIVKDFYIVPLPANTPLQSVLLPLEGPGLGENKTHLLIGIIIRQRRKRMATQIPQEIVPAKVAKESRKRSYTPPIVSKSTLTPPASPRRRPQIATYSSPALSSTVKDKIAATLASADDEEAYSPGSSTSSGSLSTPTPLPPSNALKSKMDELNRQIEEQKQQIMKMAQADSSVDEDEAYSPSRPMTPSPPVVPLANIALPSNLHEILATIKQRSETTPADVDMRNLP